MSTTTLRYQARCKLCVLYGQNVGLWEEVHRRILLYRKQQMETLRWLNAQVDRHNEPLAEDDQGRINHFNVENFHQHFRNHVSSMDMALKALSEGFSKQTNAPKSKSIGKMELESVSSEVDDYLRLHKLVEAAERRLSDYEERYQVKRYDSGGEEKEGFSIELEEIQVFQKLIKELMGMKKELMVFQTREAVAGNAVREAIEHVVTRSMSQLKDTLIEMETNLGREMPGSSLPRQMNNMVLNAMGSFMKDEVPEVLATVTDKYKIR